MNAKSANRVMFQLAAVVLVLSGACSTVPVTGRQQLSLIPSQEILSLSQQQYSEFLKQHEVIKGTPESRMVNEVGDRIKQAVQEYMRQQGREDLLQGFKWEFNLVKDDQANAFAMPGGKVVVLTGILPITQNAAGLATVMGHEIAHVIARHGNERMSQALIAQLGGVALSTALSRQPQLTQQLFMSAYGLGSQIGVLLPYSRLQESEADKIGLIFMAMAEYDPRKAVNFWQRMEARTGGPSPPQFLSTHPSAENRIADLEKNMPLALKYYHPNG